MNIILASSSPRRKALLSILCDHFSIISPDIDESKHPRELPKDYVMRVAYDKGASIPLHNNTLAIAADTTVAVDKHCLGKPESFEDAVQMLTSLSGRYHEVITGVALVYRNSHGETSIFPFYEATKVFFNKLAAKDIHNYLSKIYYRDKAGAYALQSFPELIISKIEGSKSNVVGFPMLAFIKKLQSSNLFDKFFECNDLI